MKTISNQKLGKTILSLFVIVLVAAVSFHVIYLTQREAAREQLEAEITELIIKYQNRETRMIDLSQISSFPWDRLYIFGPNQKLKYIQIELGSSWRPDSTYAPPRPYTYLT